MKNDFHLTLVVAAKDVRYRGGVRGAGDGLSIGSNHRNLWNRHKEFCTSTFTKVSRYTHNRLWRWYSRREISSRANKYSRRIRLDQG